jgi:hypothetical protein
VKSSPFPHIPWRYLSSVHLQYSKPAGSPGVILGPWPSGRKGSIRCVRPLGWDHSFREAPVSTRVASFILKLVFRSSKLTRTSRHLIDPSLVWLLTRIHCKSVHKSWRRRLLFPLSDSLSLLHLILGLPSCSSGKRGGRCLDYLFWTVPVNTLHMVKQVVRSRESTVRA